MASEQIANVSVKLANEWANTLRHGPTYFELVESGMVQKTMETMTRMESHIRWSAQTTHQAYHDDQPGTWTTCPKSTCDSAQQTLGIERG